MHLLVNECSFHGQFETLSSFQKAISRIMKMRQTALKYGREIYCNRNLVTKKINGDTPMEKAVQALPIDQRRAFMQWLTRNGPFWDDCRQHDPNDYFEHNGDIVTESAIGEAAWCLENDIVRSLASFSPSKWEYSPIKVQWYTDSEIILLPPVLNYWSNEELEKDLTAESAPMYNWEIVQEKAVNEFKKLDILDNAFSPLLVTPFSSSAAERILFVLSILDRLKYCFSADGKRTSEGHELIRKFFTGKKGEGGRGPLFSDSSDSEKAEFGSQMTFALPGTPKKEIFCPYHGKIQTPQLRIHFSFPITAEKPLYVAYIGPKITKR